MTPTHLAQAPTGALAVLAQALYEGGQGYLDHWDDLPADVQRQWADRAEVIMGRMAEVTVQVVEAPSLADAVELLEAVAARLSTAAAGGTVDALAPEYAIALLQRIRDATWLIGTVDAALVKHAYLHGEHGTRLLDGIGQVKVYRTRASEKWDERGVARAVIDSKMEERGTGLPPDDPWEVAEWLLEVLGVGYVRKTALDSLGIPRDPFYTSTPGNLRVDVPSKRR